AGGFPVGRGDLATWAAPVSRDRVPLPAGAATTGDVPLQTRADPRCGLSVLAQEHAATASSAHCPGVGGTISRALRDPARTAGAALYGGWTPRTGASLLAAGWRARRPALGQRRSDSVPHQRLGGASDAPGHPRAEPARAGVPHRARPALDGHQEFFG